MRFCTLMFSLLLVGSALHAEEWTLSQMVTQDDQGRPIYHPKPVAEKFQNPWPQEYEQEFQQRARRIIAAQSEQRVSAGNTYFENEKRTYGYLMAQALGTRGMEAVRDLQKEDAQAKSWHKHTEGIDYYAAFTLKHQMRKYFYFGDLLDDDYRERMFRGAKRWTEKDPFRRPHHAFEKPKPGWGPDAKNSWVDVRSTENLFLMRVTSVYLMAEETGNRQTAQQYKEQILKYTATLYRVGMGEWDSENYHGHSLAGLLNLYDFAQDAEVKLAAKACLDWMFAAGAVKYYRGGFNGPTKRDYNHAQPFGGSAANMLWVFFGQNDMEKEEWESDEVHLVTTAYRPPVAVMKLARKEFSQPLELFASKPSYEATTSFAMESKPEYLETQYFGHSYQMGSLAGGTRPGMSDVNGFKLLVFDRDQGAVALQAVPGSDPKFPGSPQYQAGKVTAVNRVGQYKNLAIWLVQSGKSPWCWVIPKSVHVSQRGEVTFLACDRTWVAVRGLGTSTFTANDSLTEAVSSGKKARFPGHKVLTATGKSEGYCGIAIEVGEKQSHGSFAEFQQQVLAAKVDTSKLSQGIVQYQADDGKWLGFHWNDNPHDLGLWRNGERHDWQTHRQHLYDAPERADAPAIYSRWGKGRLEVNAGGASFSCQVSAEGEVEFSFK